MRACACEGQACNGLQLTCHKVEVAVHAPAAHLRTVAEAMCKGQDVCDDDGERESVTRLRMHNSGKHTTFATFETHHEPAHVRRKTIESPFTHAISTASRRQRVDTLTALTALKGHSPGGPGPKIVGIAAENCGSVDAERVRGRSWCQSS
jgi:hypothetical protein